MCSRRQGGGGDIGDGGRDVCRASVQCPVCGRQFQGTKRNYLLNRHFQIHTGEKPYQCPHCSHRANRKSNLKMHIESRHGSHYYSRSQAPEVASLGQDSSTLGFLESSTSSQGQQQDQNAMLSHNQNQQEDSSHSLQHSGKDGRGVEGLAREVQPRTDDKSDYRAGNQISSSGHNPHHHHHHQHPQQPHQQQHPTFNPFPEFMSDQ